MNSAFRCQALDRDRNPCHVPKREGQSSAALLPREDKTRTAIAILFGFWWLGMNTIDAMLLYFQLSTNFRSWTARVRSPSPALYIKEVMPMKNKEMKAALEASE